MPETRLVTCPELSNLFSIRRDRNSLGNGRMHRHPFWELILFEQGEGNHIINGTSYEFHPKDLVLLAPSDIHQLRSKEGSTFDSIKVGFTYNVYSSHLKTICQFDHFPVIVSLCDSDYDKAAFLLKLLDDEYISPNSTGSDIFSMNILEQLVVLIARNLPERKKQHAVDTNSTRIILLYIQQHFSEPISIGDVAKSLNYSPKYFGKLFLKQMGTTFQEYLTSLRLNYAYHLIQYSDQTITDICYEAGFRSPTYFSKSFKKKYGISPNHLRKNGQD